MRILSLGKAKTRKICQSSIDNSEKPFIISSYKRDIDDLEEIIIDESFHKNL